MANEKQYIELNQDDQDSLEKLAALGYTTKEMALYLGISFDTFKSEALAEGSPVNYHIERGKLTVKANADMQLLVNAEKGNLTAIQQLARSQKEREYKDLLLQLESNNE